MTVTIGLAFLAGLASFLSPCVFALIPAYIGYLSGRSAAALQETKSVHRFLTFTHGLAFVIGFSLVFVLLGAAVSTLGGLLSSFQFLLARIGGILIIVFGLHLAEVIHVPFLDMDLRPRTSSQLKHGYLSSLMMGVFFSTGWTPCIGPVLGSIMTLVINQGSIGFGIKMLTAYSAGLAIPFLLSAFGVGWVTVWLKKYGKVLHITQIVMGWILVILGFMLFVGVLQNLARFGLFVDFKL